MKTSSIIENSLLKEKVLCRQIEPGFTAFALPKQGFQKKYAVIATNFGSIDSEFLLPDSQERIKVPDGVAHFLEHKLFEYEGGNVMDDFARLGASCNAFTNFTNTAYLFSATDSFREGLKLLFSFVQDPYFTPETVEREKGIIGQEIRMYEDNPEWRLFFNLLNALYKEHPVKIDIAGTIESISRIDDEVLHKCYRTFYHPGNMAFFAVGDFQAEEILDFAEADITGRHYPPKQDVKRFYPEEPEGINKGRITEKMVVSQPLLYLGYKDNNVGFTGERYFRKETLTEVLLEIMLSPSSKLYNDLYEEGLIDDHFAASYTGSRDYGHVIIGGETKNPDELSERLKQGIENYQKKGLPEEDFERKRKKMMGEFLKSFNSLEFVANNYLAKFFQGVDMFDYLKVLEEITINDAEARMEELFTDDGLALSVIEPA